MALSTNTGIFGSAVRPVAKSRSATGDRGYDTEMALWAACLASLLMVCDSA